jgi:hypothetical protein
MDSFQMQTPPPTRDSSTRRDFHNGQQDASNAHGGVHQGLVATPVRQVMPNTQQTPQFQTPYQYSQLQFSPEMFQYPAGGPQSAPPGTHARYPWDDSPTVVPFGHSNMMNAHQNPFDPNTLVPNPAFSEWAHHTSPLQQQAQFQQQVPVSTNQTNDSQDFWTASAANTRTAESFSHNDSFVSTTSGVNPSMLFSFSSPLQTINPTSVRSQLGQRQVVEPGSRQPYEHQTKESIREKELAKKVRQPHSRTSTASSSLSFQAPIRPGLQRSNTDSGFRRGQTRAVDSQKGFQPLESIPRRASPLKRMSQTSLTAIPETVRPRPRTRLVVDASGRARTEVVPAENGSHDDNKKSFGLWDDDDDTDEDIAITSQRNSFAYPSESLRRRPSKHARVDSDSERHDILTRPVSSASINSLASRLESTPIGKRATGDVAFRRFSAGSFGGSLTGDNRSPSKDSNATMDAASYDAQAALKKVVQDRARRQGSCCICQIISCYADKSLDQTDTQALLNAHNQRWSASIDVAKFSAIQEQERSYDPFSSDLLATSLSPTTGVPTPSTDRSVRSNESTRCLCNRSENEGQLMVQCESCSKWLHVHCVGLNELNMPPVYVCIFCTGNTPIARGGRIREPVRRTENYASPLGYKSGTQFRR